MIFKGPRRWYQVSFLYEGPRARIPIDLPDGSVPPSTKALDAANLNVEGRLEAYDIPYVHAYAWPDGSLYKYVYLPTDPKEAKAALTKVFPEPDPDAKAKAGDIQDFDLDPAEIKPRYDDDVLPRTLTRIARISDKWRSPGVAMWNITHDISDADFETIATILRA